MIRNSILKFAESSKTFNKKSARLSSLSNISTLAIFVQLPRQKFVNVYRKFSTDDGIPSDFFEPSLIGGTDPAISHRII